MNLFRFLQSNNVNNATQLQITEESTKETRLPNMDPIAAKQENIYALKKWAAWLHVEDKIREVLIC
jgi:hypothetical protein